MWHILIRLILIINIKIVQVYCESNDYNLICDDFYKYACSDWIRTNSKPHSEPYWNIYTETAQKISHTLQNILENNNDTSGIVNEKLFYKTCTQPNADYIKQFRYLINKIGGIHRTSNGNAHYDYLLHIIEITKLLNIHPILKFHVANDRMLHIDRGDLVFPEMFLTHSQRYQDELKVYNNWIEKSLSLLSADGIKSDRSNNIFAQLLRGSVQAKGVGVATLAKEIVEFEVQLAQLPSGKLTITEHKLDHVLKFLFEDMPHITIHNEFHMNEIYFDALTNLIQKTPWRVISNYIVWSSITELARDVNTDFRRLSFEVDRELIGITADLPREKECIDQVVNHIGHTNLLKRYQLLTGQDENIMIKEVAAIAADIKQTFLKRLQANEWLTVDAKKTIVKKVENVQIDILRPRWQTGSGDDEVKLEGNHLINLLKLKSRQFREMLRTLSVNAVTETTNEGNGNIEWPSNIFDVNAFYSPAQNAIILPMGILQPPFFHTSQPSALNYGALGALIGHELSHTLDEFSTTVKFTRTDLKAYNKRRNCIRNMFNSFGIDQGLTLNENIADFIGIRMSHMAMAAKYANDVREQGNSELFFLSYAKMWCELSSKQSDGKQLLMQDEHAPVGIRVDGTLRNFPSFRNTFNCHKAQPKPNVSKDVNDESTCILW